MTKKMLSFVFGGLNMLTSLWPSSRGYTATWPQVTPKNGDFNVFGVGVRKLGKA